MILVIYVEAFSVVIRTTQKVSESERVGVIKGKSLWPYA